jgi:mannose/fructose/N-acetylgalactosamine-specific phosphotransferase system component IIC
MSIASPPTSTHPSGSHERRSAWLWLASTPVFFFAAFAVGEGLASWLGIEEGAVSTFSWQELVVLVVAMAVVAVPAVGAAVVARHAKGDLLARAPAWVLGLLVAGFLVANVVGWFVGPAAD